MIKLIVVILGNDEEIRAVRMVNVLSPMNIKRKVKAWTVTSVIKKTRKML